MENITYIQELVATARKAQSIMETYDQAQVDALVKTIGKVGFDNRELLSQMACEETGLGVYAGKVAKHYAVTTSAWSYMKNKKSVGVIEEDPANGIITFAKPMGVVACITPTTNPTTTAVGNCMCAVKSRNAVVVAPHPRAKRCTAYAVELMNDAIVALGGPENLIQSIQEPSIELTSLLMQQVDVVVATGGAGMVKAAYSSGKPSYGVGQGNVQIIVDEDYDDLETLSKNVTSSRTYDNGMPCTGEQCLIMPRKKEAAILKAFAALGAYVIEDEADIEKFRAAAFVNGAINVKLVGKPAMEAASFAGISVPEGTRLLMFKLKKYGREESLCREIMCPVIRCFAYDTFEEGVAIARTNLLMEGAGHSAGIYSENDAHIRYAGDQLPVGRVMVCQPNSAAAGSSFANGLAPTISLGCGSWGNNSISENLTYKHLMNLTRVSMVIKDAYTPTAEEIWA